jgi:site-specific DNA-methyltransferase (adenine-specific)
MWEQLKRIIKPNGAIVMTASQPFTTTLIASNMKMFKYCWVWDKVSPTGHLNAKHRPMKKLEDIAVFCGGKTATYNPQGLVWNPRVKTRSSKTQGSNCYGKHNDKYIATWQGYPTERLEFKNENGLHPTQKPVALMEYLIKTYTNEGETVLDFTAGSGTTGIAALNTNRNAILIEREPEYCEIIKRRIAEAERRKNNESLVKKPTDPTLFDFMLEDKQ